MRSTFVLCVFVIASCQSAEVAAPIEADVIDRRVPPAKHVDDSSHPIDTKDAVHRAVERWNAVYELRMAAVENLMKHVEQIDQIGAPRWEPRLEEDTLAALNAVTARLGQRVVDGVFARLEATFTAGAVEVFVWERFVWQRAVERRVSTAVDSDDPSGLRTPGGTLLSPDIFFRWMQREALRDAKLDHLNRVNTTLSFATSRLDGEHPGAGYRLAVAVDDAIADVYPLAGRMQFAESLLTWCAFSAQARLGTGDPNHGRDPGTELATQVDVTKILRGENGEPARNLDKTPGVMRLELAEIAPGHVVVVRSFIDGFNNDLPVARLRRKVKDLRIPIVARFNEPGNKLAPRAFVISRNENGAILTESTDGLMQEMFGGRSDHEAARHIFEDQIAHQKLTPARG